MKFDPNFQFGELLILEQQLLRFSALRQGQQITLLPYTRLSVVH